MINPKLSELADKIKKWCDSEPTIKNYATIKQELLSRLNSNNPEDSVVGSALLFGDLACFKRAQGVKEALLGNNTSSIQMIVEAGMETVVTIRSILNFKKSRCLETEIINTSGALLAALCTTIFINDKENMRWLVQEILEGPERYDAWFDDNEYLSSMIYLLAKSTLEGSIVGDKDVELHPICQSLFTASGRDETENAMLACCEYRFDRAYKSQSKVLDDEFVSVEIAGFPFEILAFEKLYNQFNNARLAVEHDCILPSFRKVFEQKVPKRGELASKILDASIALNKGAGR